MAKAGSGGTPPVIGGASSANAAPVSTILANTGAASGESAPPGEQASNRAAKPLGESAGTNNPGPKRARTQKIGFNPVPRRRDVKECYLTEREIDGLAALNALTSILLSISGFLLALALDYHKDLVTDPTLSKSAWEFLVQARLGAGIGCVLTAGLAVYTFFRGYNGAKSIKDEHVDV